MITLSFKLKESAKEFQAGEYTGFGIRTGKKHKKGQIEVWTNYKTALFSKSPAQIDFFRANLIEGAMAVVSADNLEVETFQGQNGLQTAINLVNSKLVDVHNGMAPDAAKQAYQKGMSQPAQEPEKQSASAQAPSNFDSFEDDIPFS